MEHTARQVLRGTKNLVKGYSDVQVKVRQATSNDPWGPPGHLMVDIAEATNNHRDFLEIMEILDKRLNDSGKNWRHVFKALTLLDYLLHSGSEGVISYAKENLYVIKTLKEFQYVDEDGKDQGQNVRQKSKDIVALLADDARLKEERKNKSRMVASSSYDADRNSPLQGRDRDRETGYTSPSEQRSPYSDRRNLDNNGSEDAELQRALEESRRTAEADERRRNDREKKAKEESDLQRAMQISQDEEENRRRQQVYQQQQQQQQAYFQQQPQQSDFLGGFGSQSQMQYQQPPQPAFDPFGSVHSSNQQPGAAFGQTGNGLMAAPSYQQPTFGGQPSFGAAPNPFGTSASTALPLTNQPASQIARNTAQIDPFANLATNRQQQVSNPSLGPTASSSNPFGASPHQQQSGDFFGSINPQQPVDLGGEMFSTSRPVQVSPPPPSQWGIDSQLVNLAPQALVSAPQQVPAAMFGAPTSRNPFQTNPVGNAGNSPSKFEWSGNQGKGPTLMELQRQNQMAPLAQGGAQQFQGQVYGQPGTYTSSAQGQPVQQFGGMGAYPQQQQMFF